MVIRPCAATPHRTRRARTLRARARETGDRPSRPPWRCPAKDRPDGRQGARWMTVPRRKGTIRVGTESSLTLIDRRRRETGQHPDPGRRRPSRLLPGTDTKREWEGSVEPDRPSRKRHRTVVDAQMTVWRAQTPGASAVLGPLGREETGCSDCLAVAAGRRRERSMPGRDVRRA